MAWTKRIFKNKGEATESDPRIDADFLNGFQDEVIDSNNEIDTRVATLEGKTTNISFPIATNKVVTTVASTTSTQYATIGIPTRDGTYLVSVRARNTADNSIKYAESITRAVGTQVATTTSLANTGATAITITQLSIHASLLAIVVGYSTTSAVTLELEISYLRIN